MSTFIKDFIEREKISRRNFLFASAAGISASALPGLFAPSSALAHGHGGYALAWSYRDRASAYWNAIVSGGEAYVESLGLDKSEMVNLINEASSEKSLADIKAFLAKNNGMGAIACDANDSPNARPVVEAVRDAGGFISTIWNKTDDLHPWDIGDSYVAHLSWSGEKPSEDAARLLIDKMGGEGGIVHIGGIPANIPAIERLDGLKNALNDNPNVELLDVQSADWDTTKAADVMSSLLTRYGDEIKGVHCANDNMAYGVIEALKAEGITGMPITAFDGNPEAVDLVMGGDLLATVFTNPHWGGGIALALAHQAATGAFVPSEEPNEHREFYGPSILVTPDDAAEFKKTYLESTPTYDWTDRWGLSAGQIQYK
ncbi:MAG: sugar ABC transporter substrate-binding protein [Roseovarius sp.]|nr:sugar ABC transporter substrate-binding protein [Roseovarius sp.]MCY4316098.1 sugar ABC transporter substrate-binding protein [Roseovarius sp.]